MQEHSLRDVIIEVVRKGMNAIQDGKLNIERLTCRYCSSDIVWKYGKNRSGVQRYKCPSCGKVFLNVDALPKMRVTIRQLGGIMGQYYGGMSYKELRRQFKQQHEDEMSRSSFHRWLTKFTKIAVVKHMRMQFPVFGDGRVTYLFYARSSPQFPEDLVNPLPSNGEEQVSFVWKLLSPLKIFLNHVQCTLVDRYYSSPFNCLSILLPSVIKLSCCSYADIPCNARVLSVLWRLF